MENLCQKRRFFHQLHLAVDVCRTMLLLSGFNIAVVLLQQCRLLAHQGRKNKEKQIQF